MGRKAVLERLKLAARVSRKRDDLRTFTHGAIGIRADGTIVSSYNGAPRFPTPEHHCEFRLSKKLTPGSCVFLVRTNSAGLWANSKPCINCQNRLRAQGVIYVVYSTGTQRPFDYLYL